MDLARFRDGFGYRHVPWNRGRLLGQKPPLKLKEIWAIRIRLQLKRSHRDLALFNLAIDSKLRGCDLVSLKVDDVATPGGIKKRTGIRRRKIGRPVQFEITEQTRESLNRWIEKNQLQYGDCLFPSKINRSTPITTRQYARLISRVRTY